MTNASLPHKAKRYSPFPDEPPEGWPYEYVAAVDFDALKQLADDLANVVSLAINTTDDMQLGDRCMRVLAAYRQGVPRDGAATAEVKAFIEGLEK